MPGSSRTVQALGNRWKELQAACAKFAGHFDTVNALVRFGWQENDYIQAALKTFHETEGSVFQYCQIWEYLRNHVPKFEQILSPNSNRSKRMLPEASNNDLPDNEDSEVAEASTLDETAKQFHILKRKIELAKVSNQIRL
ncbi:hypothetical protein R1flu_001790 [Riccia fluitans]|uniref:No apical meristem-associated C-terminal domain-containing protein n=1 Tax=Riccia fluitans TaxID=41844 RepID=A0ABD1Y4A6_9MARC